MNSMPQLTQLGITQLHLDSCSLPPEDEAAILVDAGSDVFDRPLRMTPETFKAWQVMKTGAAKDHITLQVVSAFRSVQYQCDLIQRKLEAGQHIDDILKVNAIPGFSEHHTGRALDVTTPDCPPLETQFESTEAFRWLQTHADHYGFQLSYPKENSVGIEYEPWHWCFRGS